MSHSCKRYEDLIEFISIRTKNELVEVMRELPHLIREYGDPVVENIFTDYFMKGLSLSEINDKHIDFGISCTEVLTNTISDIIDHFTKESEPKVPRFKVVDDVLHYNV